MSSHARTNVRRGTESGNGDGRSTSGQVRGARQRDSRTLAQFIRAHRLAAKVGLRECARTLGMDPSNYSRFENDNPGYGRIPGEDTLERIADIVGIEVGSADYRYMHMLRDLGLGNIPEAIRESPDKIEVVRLVFGQLLFNGQRDRATA